MNYIIMKDFRQICMDCYIKYCSFEDHLVEQTNYSQTDLKCDKCNTHIDCEYKTAGNEKNCKNEPLEIKIEDNQLVISIGIHTLAEATKEDLIFKITDEKLFAEAIIKELYHYGLIETALNQASEDAIGSGCEGIEVL